MHICATVLFHNFILFFKVSTYFQTLKSQLSAILNVNITNSYSSLRYLYIMTLVSKDRRQIIFRSGVALFSDGNFGVGVVVISCIKQGVIYIGIVVGFLKLVVMFLRLVVINFGNYIIDRSCVTYIMGIVSLVRICPNLHINQIHSIHGTHYVHLI